MTPSDEAERLANSPPMWTRRLSKTILARVCSVAREAVRKEFRRDVSFPQLEQNEESLAKLIQAFADKEYAPLCEENARLREEDNSELLMDLQTTLGHLVELAESDKPYLVRTAAREFRSLSKRIDAALQPKPEKTQ